MWFKFSIVYNLIIETVLKISYGELASRTLSLQVYDYDRFTRDDVIGQVFYPLSEADITTVQLLWRDLVQTPDDDGKV